MTQDVPALAPERPAQPGAPRAPGARGEHQLARDRRGSWLPTWAMITTKHLELRKRRGLMVVVALLTIGLPFIVLGVRLIFHAADPKTYGPAGSPDVFVGLVNPMASFGFIIAATLGAAAGSTDLTDGVFRHLVITGRSRVALYLARIPAGLSILLPLVAVAFTALSLVTSFAGTSQPASLNENGVSIPLHLDQTQFKSWLLAHPRRAEEAFLGGPVIIQGGNGKAVVTPGPPARLTATKARSRIDRQIQQLYAAYTSAETTSLNPAANEMAKVGLWLVLEVVVGFMVGLGLGSLMGQRTVPTILMIVLEIILTPILASVVIPYLINGQRLIVGVAMDQLRPAVLSGGGGGHEGHAILGGRGLEIPPMPIWAMVSVIVGWILGWTVIGAWRMARRDA